MTRVVLGVCGGIAAYKAVELLRLLTESGLDVNVVPTDSALRFVGEPTWAALSGSPVASDVWSNAPHVPHVAIGQQADLVVVAPTTADFLARAAHGLASDLLGNVLLTASCPVILAPAMHTEMWLHPATQANVRILRSRGVLVLDPADGRLTGADSGPGRLPEPQAIFDICQATLQRASHSRSAEGPMDLRGRSIVISAGGTREPWDDVRYIGNRSSGRQGFALARAALARGAQVTLVVGATEVDPPAGCRVVRVETAEEMRSAMHVVVAEESPDVAVMAAAVADFRPSAPVGAKITKESLDATSADAVPRVSLERTSDVLAELVAKRGSAETPCIVGFAAETPDHDETLAQRAEAKRRRKGCDFIVANDVSGGAVFGSDQTSIVIVGPGGEETELHGVGKLEAAHALWDLVFPTPRPVDSSVAGPSAG